MTAFKKMRANADEVGAITRDQLLMLAQLHGSAPKAMPYLLTQALAILCKNTAGSSSSTVLSLLSAAVELRLPEWTQSLTQKQEYKRQRVSSSNKKDVVFAAKMAQSLVKTYATTSGVAVKDEELANLVAAMDLACVALYVVCALEHTVRLGELVVDNLLYQVAKKYAEMPDKLESASCVAACVHVRLWNHWEPSEGTRDKSKLMLLLDHQWKGNASLSTKLAGEIELVAELPLPGNSCTAPFARLLLGHSFTCMTLLVAVKKYEAALQVAETTISSWISHLLQFSGLDAKLASSFSDRTFRMLWKIAAAVDGAKLETDVPSKAIRFRMVSLSFLLKCSSYTSVYFIQQVHRVGVQHERVMKRSLEGLNEIYRFYHESANHLSSSRPLTTHLYSSDSFQWEFIHWLEHFSIICELSGMHLRSAMVLEHAIQYVGRFENIGKHIKFCLVSSIAGSLFSAICCENQDSRPSESSDCSTSAICKYLESGTEKMIHDLTHCPSLTDEKYNSQCENAARLHLEKLTELAPLLSFVSLDLKNDPEFIPFLTRSIKRSMTKIYTYAVSAQHSTKDQLFQQVITSLDAICKALEEISLAAASLDVKIMDSLTSEQIRLHRMAVILSARSNLKISSKRIESLMPMISRHVAAVQKLLDNATQGGKFCKSLLLEVLADLNYIARECYSFAAYCYKLEHYEDTILALHGIFELATRYFDYALSSDLSVEDIKKAYAQLKVDVIASLLAQCYREVGNWTKARLYTGCSIMYFGDILETIPQASINKYVSCILEEVKLFGNNAQFSITNEFKAFLDSSVQAFKSRSIHEIQVQLLWREFRYFIEQTVSKSAVSLRGKDFVGSDDVSTMSTLIYVSLCGTITHQINCTLVASKRTTRSTELLHKSLLTVSQTLTSRKEIFCTYYAKRDVCDLINGLKRLHESLTAEAENLLSLPDAVGVDIGGIYGWRGVVTMEIALIMSYNVYSSAFTALDKKLMSELNVVADLERCLDYWSEEDPCGILFDEDYMVQCLGPMCNTLSLISCAPLEQTARKLLKTLQLSRRSPVSTLCVVPAPFELFNMNYNDNISITKATITASTSASALNEMQLLDQVDSELLAAKTSHLNKIDTQACQHLRDAITTLNDIKQNLRNGNNLTVLKAIGLRELLVHMILSNICFYAGRSKRAITEAKHALRICWKLINSFAVLSLASDKTSFELPPEFYAAGHEHQKSTPFLHFMALESSSWDLLLAVKVSLCRISTLYSLSDQPHRAALYLTEAMRLVGGLNLRFFRRSPIYEYAELELNASRLDKAKVAISFLSFNTNSDMQISAPEDAFYGSSQSDQAILEQKCNEIIQQGDVYSNENMLQEAMACYTKAINLVESAEEHQSVVLMKLGRAKSRCWRKLTRFQSQNTDFDDPNAVEILFKSMKRLKRSLKSCARQLERVKCMLELGRINTILLRSGSPRAFTSLYRTISSLEEAYTLGNHLGISHLNQELRTALGMAYFAEIEELAHENIGLFGNDDRTTFLSWANGLLLANAGSDDACEKELCSVDLDVDKVTDQGDLVQLEQLAADSRAIHELPPHEFMAHLAKQTAQKVQELPEYWIIVSLMVGLSSELVVTRFSTNGSAPVSFCLPNVAWSKCIFEMAKIIQDSRELLSGHTAEEASSWTTEQKKEWWNSRNHLDGRIEETIGHLQQALGFWRCLLVGGTSIERKCVEECWKILTHNTTSPIKLAQRNQSLLRAIADAQQYLSDSEVINGLKHITAEIELPASDSILQEALQVLRTDRNGIASKTTYSSLSSLSTEHLTKLKVAELKQLLAAEGLGTDGLKKTLVHRLIAARDAALMDEVKSRTPSGNGFDMSIVLILTYQLQQFPWEGMDVMSLCSGVTRMPSLDLLLQNASTHASIRRSQVRYLVNPAGDLKSTQTQVGSILESGAATYGWNGIVGNVPDPDTLRDYLIDADLYIYCGHGAGEAYLHRDKVLSLESNCSAALLFGCSSGRLEREGIFGPSGAVLSYLRAGSPAVVAMLWDVTDRDIDQLSVQVLAEWLLGDKNESLAHVLQSSRSICKLKFLNGHAAVCYGLPLYVTQS